MELLACLLAQHGFTHSPCKAYRGLPQPPMPTPMPIPTLMHMPMPTLSPLFLLPSRTSAFLCSPVPSSPREGSTHHASLNKQASMGGGVGRRARD